MSTRDGIEYIKEPILGRGSFATVYKGTFQNQNVAVKVISPDVKGSKHALAEISALQRSGQDQHENVLKCIHIEDYNGHIFMCLELCRANLKEHIATNGQRILPVVIDKLSICTQITAGMNYLHSQQIIHRDLKPENILFYVTPYETQAIIKVADFGLSLVIADDRSSITMSRVSGTPGWMAPELLRYIEDEEMKQKLEPTQPMKATTAMDIFSLGCLLHYVLIGKHPFGSTTFKRQQSILEGKPISKNVVEEIDPDFMVVINLMLDNAPEKRPKIHEVLHFFTTGKIPLFGDP